jgi:hypothetical protein
MDKRQVATELLRMAKELSTPEKKAAEDSLGPWATLTFGRRGISFSILPKDSTDARTGSEPYGRNPKKALETVMNLLDQYDIPGEMVEILT